jgi:hypothetical protein
VKSTGKTKKKNAVPAEPVGSAEEDINEAEVQAIVQKHDDGRGGLIAVLEGIQQKYSYLPEKVLRILSNVTGRSLVDIYGVATFYRSHCIHGVNILSRPVSALPATSGPHLELSRNSNDNLESRLRKQLRTRISRWRL